MSTRVAEYSIIEREIKNAANEYKGIGTVEISEAKDSFPRFHSYIKTDPRLGERSVDRSENFPLYTTSYEPLSRGQIASVLEPPYITGYDTRYMTAGISDKYYRLDEGMDYYHYTARHVIEATLSDVEYNIINNGIYFYKMTLTNPTLFAGDPTHLPDNKEIEIYGYSKKIASGEYSGFVNPIREIITYDSDYKYDSGYIEKLPSGLYLPSIDKIIDEGYGIDLIMNIRI